jgi:hypothetical protein
VCGQRAFEIHACVGPALMRRKQPCGCLSTTYVVIVTSHKGYYRMQKSMYIYVYISIATREQYVLFDDESFITLKGVYTSEFYLSTCSAKVWVFFVKYQHFTLSNLIIREWIAQQAAWMSVCFVYFVNEEHISRVCFSHAILPGYKRQIMIRFLFTRRERLCYPILFRLLLFC